MLAADERMVGLLCGIDLGSLERERASAWSASGDSGDESLAWDEQGVDSSIACWV